MIEDQTTEFKETYSDTLIKTAIAFSNGIGGRIFVGINDEGKVCGLNDADDICKRCVQALADKIRPDITRTSEVTIESIEGKNVIEISISQGTLKPYYLREKGLRPEGVFIRRGTSTVPATDDVFYQLMRESISSSYEELISFNQDLTFDYFSQLMDNRGLQFDKDHMESLHMIHNGKYTNLAFILSDQFDQPIKMAAFSDDHKRTFLDRDIAEGSVLKQSERAIGFIMKHNRLSAKIEGLYREDAQEFPETAVREAVLNAIVHRDYSSNATTLISIMPDKLTIVSPGNLFTNYTDEDLFRGVSSLRNKNLANILYRLKLIEAYGTGLPRIMDSYAGCDKKPSVISSVSTFTIILPATDTPVSSEMDAFLTRGREFTRLEMQTALDLNRTNAVAEVARLLKDGRIVKIGQGRGTRYRVI